MDDSTDVESTIVVGGGSSPFSTPEHGSPVPPCLGTPPTVFFGVLVTPPSEKKKRAPKRQRPPCGTMGCTLPDLHYGLHVSGSVQSTVRSLRSSSSTATEDSLPLFPSPPPSPLEKIRVGVRHQVESLPKEEATPSVDRGDVCLSSTTETMEDLLSAEALSADMWRRAMHARYLDGERDDVRGHGEEDVFHAAYPSRPKTGLREGVDPCDEERMDEELTALLAWSVLAMADAP